LTGAAKSESDSSTLPRFLPVLSYRMVCGIVRPSSRG
jgi:hypothetical protein